MSLRTITETTLDYLDSKSEVEKEPVEGAILVAQQAISQPVAAEKSLPPDKLTVEERETVGLYLEEIFLEAIRPLTPQIREKMVREAARGFRALYIDEAKGAEGADFILNKLEQGGYDCYDRQFPFTEQLIKDLQPAPRDEHLRIQHFFNLIPSDDPDRSLQDLKIEEMTPSQLQDFKKYSEEERSLMREINFGVASANILENTNIGYLKITAFTRPDFEETFQKIDEAMTKVKDATALVVDLRENNGGCPDTVARLASYFFDEKTILNRIYQRSTDTTTEFYAEPDQVFRFGEAKPVYILVGSKTCSAGEEFAYDLQARKRAVVIGQTTWGGAHPTRNFVIDDHFFLRIPNKKAKNPITDKNWETDGVIPDHKMAPTEDALTKAISLLDGGVL